MKNSTESCSIVSSQVLLELGSKRDLSNPEFGYSASVTLPRLLKENRKLPNMNTFDKIFASCWLSEENIAIASKDNQFAVWSTRKNRVLSIPLPRKQNDTRPEVDHCGIHFISKNTENSLLATGGHNPADVAIFRLPCLTPCMLLQGHRDWVFASDFVEPQKLISGGRDCLIKLWDVSPDDKAFQIPFVTRREHTQKVRDLKFCPILKKLVTVSADGTAKIWDASNLDVISTAPLELASEVMCVAIDAELQIAAVGTQYTTILIDIRDGKELSRIRSNDQDWGVRSVNISHGVLSMGGGLGRLSFFDLRTNEPIPISPDKPYHTSGSGWLNRDTTWITHFNGSEIPNAVYTHSYSPSKTKVFVGGGPLMLSLKGSYGAIWE